MPLLPEYTPIRQLKELQARILFSKTDLVSKATDGSVLNGLLYASAKTAQKALKDVALTAAHLFPDTAYGDQLDAIADNYGIPNRFGSSKSSMYVRFNAEEGTTYTALGHDISTDEGTVFELVEDVSIGEFGFNYGLCRSKTEGFATNVSSLSVTGITNAPTGHSSAVNEFQAFGGRDLESDDDFRQRIKDSFNIASQGTYAKLALVLTTVEPTVLKVVSHGLSRNGKLRMAVIGRSGQLYTDLELNNMRDKAFEFMSLSETNVDYLSNKGIEIVNITWFPVDISFRARLDSSYDVEALRKRVQISINKLFDPRNWNAEKKVEWDDILQEVKRTVGVNYVSDASFIPRVDLVVTRGSYPRVRMFEMRDLDGNIIFSGSDNASPIDYDQFRDYAYLNTVLQQL